jgi:hypothetical protein
MNFDPTASLYAPGSTGLSRRVAPARTPETTTSEARSFNPSHDGDQYLGGASTSRIDTGLYTPARIVSACTGQPRPQPAALPSANEVPPPRTRAEAQMQAALATVATPDDDSSDFQLGFAITA